MNEIIPKKIHYCWFGKRSLPKFAKECIASWRKFLPDYEIIEWNENNFDINSCNFIKQAYHAKKYAFVSDYVRFKVLYENGGLYFDVDVKIIKTINDIIEKGSFMACERDYKIAPGLGLAAIQGLDFYKEIIQMYENLSFIDNKGFYNLKPIVLYITEKLTKYGFKKINEIQKIQGIYIYPEEYFAPKNWKTKKLVITENTRAIHYYWASWVPLTTKFKSFIKRILTFLWIKNIRTLKNIFQ